MLLISESKFINVNCTSQLHAVHTNFATKRNTLPKTCSGIGLSLTDKVSMFV